MNRIQQVVILAGGQGTRLHDTIGNHPKCLVPFNGVDLLTQNILRLAAQGFSNFLLLLGEYAEEIIAHIPQIRKRIKVEFEYIVEEKPLGTGGALINAFSALDDFFLLFHGDLYIDFDTTDLISPLLLGNTDYCQVYHASSHMHDSDLIELDSENRIVQYILKPHSSDLLVRNRANAGVYAFSKAVLLSNTFREAKIDLDRDVLPALLQSGVLGVGVQNVGYIKDIGTPERLAQTSGEILDSFMLYPRQPAIFLDRDGTLNLPKGYISSPDQIEIYPDSYELISYCNRLGIRVIVVTNQPIIARGEASVKDLDLIHARIDQVLGSRGLYIDDYYYCPHHPDSGFENEVAELKIDCECRKPKNGLIEKAFSKFALERDYSFMIGDKYTDIEAGESSGLTTVLVSRTRSHRDSNISPNFVVSNLKDIIEIVKNKLETWPLSHKGV